MIMCLRDGQLEHICRLHVRHLLEHTHEFGEVVESGESRFGSVAGAFGGKLNGSDCLAKGARPCVKVEQAVSAEGIILQVLLHGVHFHHAVGNGRAGGENHASAAGQLVQVTAFHVEVRALHCLRLADAAHIAHF